MRKFGCFIFVWVIAWLIFPAISAAQKLSLAPVAAPSSPSTIILQVAQEGQPILQQNQLAHFASNLGEPDRILFGAALSKQLQEKVSRFAGGAPISADLRQQITDGWRWYIEGKYEKALEIIEPALKTMMPNVAALASDQLSRDSMHEALIALAQIYLRLHQEEKAEAMMSEVLRSFPDRDLSMMRFGPEMANYYRKVRRELDRHDRGSLTIKSNPPQCMAFVNERFVGLTPAKVMNLYPGKYRVYVQIPQVRGRIHEVQIDAEDKKIDTDLNLDQALETEKFAGLKANSIASVSNYAAQIAQTLGASRIVLLSASRQQERVIVEGKLLLTEEKTFVRGGIVALADNQASLKGLATLAHYLATGSKSKNIIASVDEKDLARARSLAIDNELDENKGSDSRGGFFSARVFRWITLGLGAGAVAGGVTLLVLHGKNSCEMQAGQELCKEQYNTRTPGIALTATGGALLGISGWLFYLTF